MTGDNKMSDEPAGLRLRLFGRTDVGQIREHNEDNFLVANLSTGVRGLMEENRNIIVEPGGVVLGVCDGMGGAAAGEIASQMAVDLIHEQLSEGEPARERDELARRLVQSIEYTGAAIFQDSRSDRSRRGMGTTATIAVFLDERLFVGQVGDSRAYLLRGGKLSLLSRDQSLVNQLIEAGQLTEEEAETFEHNNIILQALGTSETVQVDLTYVDLCKGDVLMMCSDGLSGMIRNEEIREVLENTKEPLEACRELTDRANAAGGHDNITVIVARVEDGVGGPTENSSFGYQKYTLPDLTPEAPDAIRRENDRSEGGNDEEDDTAVSEEAAQESRKLRVSHTMIGVINPLATTPMTSEVPPGLHAAAQSSRPRADVRSEVRNTGSFPPPGKDKFARESRNSEEPVALPTHGFPPALMAIIVICTLLLAGLFGYLIVR